MCAYTNKFVQNSTISLVHYNLSKIENVFKSEQYLFVFWFKFIVAKRKQQKFFFLRIKTFKNVISKKKDVLEK